MTQIKITVLQDPAILNNETSRLPVEIRIDEQNNVQIPTGNYFTTPAVLNYYTNPIDDQTPII